MDEFDLVSIDVNVEMAVATVALFAVAMCALGLWAGLLIARRRRD